MTRYIPKNTERNLSLLSKNRCAFPNCTQALYIQEKNIYIGEICHIEALNETGARFNPNQTNEERNSLSNLILMCPTHHTLIDKKPEEYTVSKLKEFKKNHENNISTQDELILIHFDIDVLGVTENKLDYKSIDKDQISSFLTQVYQCELKYKVIYHSSYIDNQINLFRDDDIIDIVQKNNAIRELESKKKHIIEHIGFPINFVLSNEFHLHYYNFINERPDLERLTDLIYQIVLNYTQRRVNHEEFTKFDVFTDDQKYITSIMLSKKEVNDLLEYSNTNETKYLFYSGATVNNITLYSSKIKALASIITCLSRKNMLDSQDIHILFISSIWNIGLG